ncbi:MAG: hypothetical protein MJZ75_03425 [Paludibacteraceae bacterium]|nr:hypothetical protein [Paludibacteraceae bacterium]
MKKLCTALMLCLISIASFANFSVFYCFGTRYSEGDCVPKSYNWEEFREVEWSMMSDAENIVLNMDNDVRMVYRINRKYTDTNTGVTTFFVTDMLQGLDMKLYYYLNEACTKYFHESNQMTQVYELDINDYTNRRTISVLFFEPQKK